MTTCRLVDVATVDSGAGFPLQHQGIKGESFPFLKVSDMNLVGNERAIRTWNHSISENVRRTLRAKAFPAGALIFPKIGAAIGTNKKRLLTQPSCVDNNVMAVIPKVGLLESEFLYFLFLAKNLSDFASDSNPPSMRKSDVENWTIRATPLPEQRRIVDLLSRAEGIVRLRREAEKKAAELIPALFNDIFGDPATNPKGWPIEKLDGLLRSIDSGHSPVCHTRKRLNQEWCVLKLSALTGSEYHESEHKVLPEEVAPDQTVEVRRGDLLISRKNTAELVGTAAYVWDTQGKALLPDLIFRLNVADSNRLNSVYLWGLLTLPFKRVQIKALASGSAGSMPNISKARLKTLDIEVPPLDRQTAYAQALEQIISIRSQQFTATAKAQATFDALLARCFTQPVAVEGGSSD